MDGLTRPTWVVHPYCSFALLDDWISASYSYNCIFDKEVIALGISLACQNWAAADDLMNCVPITMVGHLYRAIQFRYIPKST